MKPPVNQPPPGQGDDEVPLGSVCIKKRSRVPGVMITQYVEAVPVGKATPDFTRKPIALTIQEGKTAFFKAVVTGEPAPSIDWARNNGELTDPQSYISRYDERNREYVLEIPNIKAEQCDTYKCFATNEFGRAVCTATLNVIEVGFKKKPPPASEDPEDFRKMLKKSNTVRRKQLPLRKEGEIDPKFWEVLLTATKKDYEKICREYGITDFRWMLKRLNQMKKERKDQQAKVVEKVENVKQIEVKPDGKAEFELDMTLKDPNSNINLYKDGVELQYGVDSDSKHSLKQIGSKYIFSIKDLNPEDAGFYQVDVEDANVLSTDFKIPEVEFAAKIPDVKAVEGEDAIFQCVLSIPLQSITWASNEATLESGEKYEITASQDLLTHTLKVKNCEMTDKGTFYAIAGIAKCSALLSVEEDKNKGRKSSNNDDLDRLDRERQARLQKEKDDLEAAKRAKAEREAAEAAARAAAAKAALDKAAAAKAAADKAAADKAAADKAAADKAAADKAAADKAVADKAAENTRDMGDGKDGGDGNNGDGGDQDKNKKQVRNGPLLPDTVIVPKAQFISGLSDTAALLGKPAELSCKLSRDTCEGLWFKDGKPLLPGDGVIIIKEGACHKLIIDSCRLGDHGVYRFEADGRKSEAALTVQNPPTIDLDALNKFSEPVIVRAGETAQWKLPFTSGDPMTITWFKDDEELLNGLNVKIEKTSTQSRLCLTKCQRKDCGEVKIKLKNEFGVIEATSKLIVLYKPTPPQRPVDIVESALTAVEFKWKPPKDNGGCPLTNYVIERQQVGLNKWSNLGEIPIDPPIYRDKNVDPGRKYCYRIKAKNVEGISEAIETEDIQAGVLSYPGPPAAPKVISAFKDCISLTWCPPSNTGGTNILGYNLEKLKSGTNFWIPVNLDGPIKDTNYGVRDVIEGASYEFRVIAINISGAGEASPSSNVVIARDPKKPPGKVVDLKLTSSDYTKFSLTWTKPKEVKGVEDEATGYFVEIRPIESPDWIRCNVNPITPTSFNVIGLKAMAMYWVRVRATNYGGDGLPQGFDNYIVAMPPPVRPKFTDSKRKNFMVVREGNTIRVNISFEASPLPEITWLKDGVPVSKRVTVTNSDTGSQFLISTSERSDTGIYTIIVKNLVGHETCNVEIRVTDDPKPPGPVELEENVPGTVTVTWTPSPDEKRDDRLHYMVSKRDSIKRTWRTVADNLYNHKCTIINILPGREYHFRVFTKNDMGFSVPAESPTWGTKKIKEKITVNISESIGFDFQSPPKFLVPLKRRTAPEGYECYISCAVKGDPAPYITWYHNNVSLNTNTNYLITNVCGVCSLLILKVGSKDTGEYKVIAENPLGREECVTKLNVK